MEKSPVIQVLSKNNYEENYYVSLPNAYPLPSLGQSSIRVQTNLLSLTTNNLSYARLAHLLGWWEIHPLPTSIPVKFYDPSKFGRISCWGYGVVTESTVPEIKVGAKAFGYLPIGTLPVDMEVQLNAKIPGQFFEISKHRAHALPLYNRYLLDLASSTALDEFDLKQSQGYDSLMHVLFETSYMMNRFVFAWDLKESVYPQGNGSDGWTFEQGAVDKDTIFILFAASGKTGLAFAYNLKYNRPADKMPREIIAVGSLASHTFTEGTGFFDKVLHYDADQSDLATKLDLAATSKIILCDFGGRNGAVDRWAAKLSQGSQKVLVIPVGGEVVADSPETTMEKFRSRMALALPGVQKSQVNASILRTQAMDILGEKEYYEEFLKVWSLFKERGGVKGLRLVWGEGMGDVAKGWKRLCSGEVGPDEGLLYELKVEVKAKAKAKAKVRAENL